MRLIDTVPVVRCRDCRWFNTNIMECECDDIATDHEGGASFSLNFGPDDFCSYGERKGVCGMKKITECVCKTPYEYIQIVLAIETLAYHNKNYLDSCMCDNAKRSEEIQALLIQALKEGLWD